MNEYVTLDELKAWIGELENSDRYDTMLAAIIETASRQVDELCGRRFYLDEEASERTYPVSADRRTIFTDDFTTAEDVEDYTTLGGGEGRPFTGLKGSTGTDTLSVVAVWGWAEVPPQVKQATKILAARLFQRRNSPEGAMGFSDLGPMRLSGSDPDVKALLAPYTKLKFGAAL